MSRQTFNEREKRVPKTFASRRLHALIIAFLAVALSFPVPITGYSLERVGGVSVSENAALAQSAPAVSIPSGILRTTDGRTLWERNATDERAMASITKIMTALVVLDKADPSEKVTISPAAASVKESGVDLVAGETYTVQQLLEAMLVPSANDAAWALSEHVAGNEAAFVAMMNQKAADLGLEHTAFTNPHGLDEPGHHTTAEDIADLTAVAMADSRFASIVQMPAITMTVGGVQKRFESSNKLLTTYDGANGVKTGWTNAAGYCVVVSAKRGDIGLVAVVLGAGSEDARFAQARALLDWGFQHYALTQVASAETTAGLVPVTDYLDQRVAAVVADNESVPVFDLDGSVTTSVDLIGEVDAPVAEGQRLGTLSVVQGGRLLAQVPIVAAKKVAEPKGWDAVEIWFTRLWRTVFGGQLQAKPVSVM